MRVAFRILIDMRASLGVQHLVQPLLCSWLLSRCLSLGEQQAGRQIPYEDDGDGDDPTHEWHDINLPLKLVDTYAEKTRSQLKLVELTIRRTVENGDE